MASSSIPGARRRAGALSVGLFLLLWQGASLAAGDPGLFPGPGAVLSAIAREAADGALFEHLGATLARVAATFVLAMGVGTAIGLLMGLRRGVDAWGDPWLVLFLNLPALVTIVLCYIWIGLTEVAAIAAVAINKIPLVATMMREGARALDPGLADMARVFRMSRWAELRHVILPQLGPDLAAAGRAGLSLIWKIVLVVEFLGRSSGVGFQIHTHFQLFDVTTVLAYAFSFMLVVLAIETFLLQPWERRANRWRTGG